MTKKEFRQFAIKKRNSLSSEERISFSNQILQHLINSEIYQDSKKIFMYLSFQSEVDTFQLLSRALQDNKEVYAPITLPDEKKLLCGRVEDPDRDLEKNFYGILSPILQDNNIASPTDIDFVIVPGVAFDIHGYRMGYGGGYYDCFLPTLSKNAKIVALAFEEQIYPDIPKENHDIKMQYIVTEKRFLIL